MKRPRRIPDLPKARRFHVEPLEERIMLSATPESTLMVGLDPTPETTQTVPLNPWMLTEASSEGDGSLTNGPTAQLVVQPLVNTLADAIGDLNEALADWQTRFAHELPILPSDLAGLLDLTTSEAPLAFDGSQTYTADTLLYHLQTLGFRIDGFGDGYTADGYFISAAQPGMQLNVSGDLVLFSDRTVADPYNGERLNDTFHALLRGFASELDLLSDVDWRASLRLAVNFSVTDGGAFVLGEGTELVLNLRAEATEVTGTIRHADLTLTPAGTLSADYRLSFALRETSAGESLQTLAAEPDTHFRQFANGSATLALAGTLEAASWQLTQTFTAAGQNDGSATALSTADALTIALPLPGHPAPILLSGEYDATANAWMLQADSIVLAPFGEVNLSATLSADGLQGTLNGRFDGRGLEIRDVATGAPISFNLNFDAATIGGTFTAQNVNATVRDANNFVVTQTVDTELGFDLAETSLTSDSLNPSLTLTAETIRLGDGETATQLQGNGALEALSARIDLSAGTLQLSDAAIVATPMPGVTLRADLTDALIDLQTAPSESIAVDAILEIASLTVNGTAIAIAGTLRWDREAWSFDPQEGTHSLPRAKFGAELSLFNSQLRVDRLTYNEAAGWEGAIGFQSAVAYLWLGGSQVSGAILPAADGTPGALSGQLDLGAAQTTLNFDGLRLSLGSMASVTLPAFSSSFAEAEGLPDVLASVDGAAIGSRQLAGDQSATVNGVQVTRSGLIVPAFQQAMNGTIVIDDTLVLNDSQFGSLDGFAIANDGSHSQMTGRLEVHSATGGLFAPGAATVIGAGATLDFGAGNPSAPLTMMADRVLVDVGGGRQLSFDQAPVSGTSTALDLSGQMATVLENGVSTGAQRVHQLTYDRDGQMTLQESAPNQLVANELLLGGLIRFAISGSEATATDGVFSATGILDFSAYTQAGLAVAVTVGGVTRASTDAPTPITLSVIEDANGASLLDSGEVRLQISALSIGELAEVNLSIGLGAYVAGAWQADGAGSAQLRFKDTFENHETGYFTGAANLAQVDGVWQVSGEIAATLKSFLFDLETVPLSFGLDLAPQANGLLSVTTRLRSTSPIELNISPVPKVSLGWGDALFDFTATGDAPLVLGSDLTARLVLTSVQLTTAFEGLFIDAGGGLALAADGAFRIAFTGLEDSNLLDDVKWPNWLPIQINSFVFEWADIRSDWTDLKVVVSAEARSDIGEALKMGLSGAITGLVLDFGLLDQGKFPFVAIDEVALQVGGGLAALPVQGRAILGLLRLDADGEVIPTADRATPVAETVLYAAIDGTITIKGYGLGLYLGLSSYGPLGGYISASAPLPVGGPTGFVLGGLRGGIQFFSETPEIDDAATLDDNSIPAITPIANQSFGVWRQGFQQQLRDQVAAFSQPTSVAALNAVLSAPFRIEGGGTFFNVYSSRNAFEANVDVFLDSSGTLTLVGSLQMLSLPGGGSSQQWKSLNKYLAWFHFDISDALTQGEVDILAHIKQEGVFSKVAFSAWGSLEIDFGATIDPANPPEIPFENITLLLNGGLGFSLFTYEFVRFDGIVEIGANLSEPRLIIGFSGDVSIAAMQEALGPLNAGAGRFEIFFDEAGIAQTVGAIELGNIVDLPFSQIAGVTLGGQGVLRLNTTGEAIDFEVPSLADPTNIRSVRLAANTGDLFIEGGIGIDVVGTTDLNMTGQFSVGFRSAGFFVYAKGAIHGYLLGGNRVAQGWDYSAEALFNLFFDGIAPGVAATFRLQAEDRQRYGQIAPTTGLAAVDLTLEGNLSGTINTTAREVSFEVPTEHAGLFGENTVVIAAALTRGDGTVADAGAYATFGGTGFVRFNDWLATEGRIYLGHAVGEAATLETDGATAMRVNDETVFDFNAKGRFLLGAGGLYGSLTATADAQTPFAFDEAIAPIDFTGSLRLAVNSTGAAQTIDGLAVEAGNYARLIHEGTLNIGGFVSTGTHTFELLPNESIRVSFDSTLTAAVAAGDLFGFRATGSLIVVDTGIYGDLALTVADAFTPVAGWNVSLAGSIRLQTNTTLEDRDGIPANLGTRITVAGALLVGDQANIAGTHFIQSANDVLTLDLNGTVDLRAEDESGTMQSLLSLPIDVTFDVDAPVIQESVVLDLPEEHRLFSQFGFDETSSIAFEVNTSTAAPAEGAAQGPYARIAVNGALLRSGQSLTGQFYLYQDIRTIRADGAVELLLQAGGTELMHFEFDLAMQLSFAGLAGWARGGVKEVRLPGDLLQDIGSAEFTLAFNSDVDQAVIPREGDSDVTLRGGPFFEVTTNGDFDLAGIQSSGDLAFLADAAGIQLALDGTLRILIPDTPDVFYESLVEGRFFLNGDGLYGALELEQGLEIPDALGFAFQQDPAQKVRLAINTTGQAHQLTETLTLEAGNYARLGAEGELKLQGFSLTGRLAIEVEDRELSVDLNGLARLYIPNEGAGQTLMTYSVAGNVSILRDGIAGQIVLDNRFNTELANSALASVGINFTPGSGNTRVEFNTTNREVVTTAGTLEAGRYGRLVSVGIMDLGLATYEGTFIFQIGQFGLEVLMDNVVGFGLPANELFEARNLLTLEVVGGLRITADGVAGILSVVQTIGDTDSFEINGFEFGLSDVQSARLEINFTNKEQIFADRTLAAGKYIALRGQGAYSAELGDLTYAGQMPEFYLQLAQDGLKYAGFAEESITLDDGVGGRITLYKGTGQVSYFINQNGVYGFKVAQSSADLSGLRQLGINIAPGTGGTNEEVYTINFTGGEQTVSYNDLSRTLKADERISLSQVGVIGLRFSGSDADLVSVSGLSSLIVRDDGLQVQVGGTANVLGKDVEVNGLLRVSILGIVGYLGIDAPEFELGDVVAVEGGFEFAINTTAGAVTFTKVRADLTTESMTIAAGAFRINVSGATIAIAGTDLVSGDFYFERDGNGIWKGVIGEGATPFQFNLLPGITATASGFLAEDGTHAFSGTAALNINTGDLVSIDAVATFSFIQETVEATPLGVIQLAGDMTLLGSSAPINGLITRSGDDWTVDIEAVSIPVGQVAYNGSVQLVYRGDELLLARLNGKLELGGFEISGNHVLEKVGGVTVLQIDGEASVTMRDGNADDETRGEGDLLFSVNIDGQLIGQELADGSTEWYGGIVAQTDDAVDLAARLRDIGIDIDSTKIEFTLQTNTTGAAQSVTLPDGTQVDLEAGNYTRFAYNGDFGLGLLEANGDLILEKSDGGLRAFVALQTRLETPGLGAIPSQEIVSYRARGYLGITSDGIGGRLNLEGGLLQNGAEWIRFIKGEEISGVLDINFTGKELVLSDELTLPGPSFVQLTINAEAQLLGLSTAVMNGEFKFRLATNSVQVLVDAQVRAGFPANDAFDAYLTVGTVGTFVADYRGVHGLLDATPNANGGSKPELGINLSAEAGNRLVLNTTGSDIVVGDVTLAADRIVGLEVIADLDFILGDFDGEVFIGFTGESLLFDLDGDLSAFSSHQLAVDGILEVRTDGLRFLAQTTFPELLLGGANGLRLSGAAFIRLNTTGEAFSIETGDVIPPDTAEIRLRDLDLSLTPLLGLSGNAAFGRVTGGWVGQIDPAQPLTTQLLGIETVVNGSLNLPDTGPRTWNLTSTTAVNFGTTDLGLVGDIRMTSNETEGTRLVFDGSVNGLVELAGISGEIELNADGFSLMVDAEALAIKGYGASGKIALRYTESTGVVRIEAAENLVLALPAVGGVTLSGYAQSDGDIDLRGITTLSLGDRNVVSLEDTLNVNITGFDQFEARFGGKLFLADEEIAGESVQLRFDQDTFTFRRAISSELIQGYQTAGVLTITAGLDAMDQPYVRAETLGADTLQVALPLFGAAAFTGSFDTRGLAVALSASVALDQAVGLAPEARVAAAITGQIGASYNVAETAWSLQLGGSYSLTAMGASASGILDRSWGGEDIAFTLSGPFNFAGFTLNGSVDLLLDTNTVNLQINPARPLTLSHPVFGAVAFQGFFNSPSDFALTGSAALTTGAGLPIELAGTAAFALNASGMAANFTGTLRTGIVTQTLTQTAFTFSATEFSFVTMPLALEIRGFAINGAYALSVSDNGAGGKHFTASMTNAALAIPMLGSATVSGTFNNAGAITLSGNVALALGVDGLLAMNGSAAVSMSNTHFTAAFNGSVNLLGTTTDSITATAAITTQKVDFQVTNIKTSLAGLELAGGFGLTVAMDGSTPVVTARMGEDVGLLRLDTPFFGDIDFTGDIDVAARRVSLSGTASLDWSASSTQPNFLRLVGDSTFSVAGSIDAFDLQIEHGQTLHLFGSSQALNFTTSYRNNEFFAEAFGTWNLGFASGSGLVQMRANSSEFTLTIPEATPLTTSFLGTAASITGSWSGSGAGVSWNNVRLTSSLNFGLASEVNFSGTATLTADGNGATGRFTGAINSPAGSNTVTDLAFHSDIATYIEFAATPLNIALAGISTNANGVYRFERGLNGEPDYHRFALASAPGSSTVVMRSGDSIAMPESLDLSGGYTVETWLKLDSTDGDRGIFGKLLTSSNASELLHLIVRGGKLLQGHFADDLAGSTTLEAGRWYHVAFTYDAASGTQAIYLDGVLEGQRTVDRPLNDDPHGIYRIGATIGPNFDGQFDNFRIWNHARSAEEIAFNQAAILPAARDGLFYSLPFENGTGSAIRNVGTATDLTFSGSPEWARSAASATLNLPGVGSIAGAGYLDASGDYFVAGSLAVNVGNNTLGLNGSLIVIATSEGLTSRFNGHLTVAGFQQGLSGDVTLVDGNFRLQTQLSVNIGGGLQASGSYTIEFSDSDARATAQGVTLNLPGLSNSRVNINIDTTGAFSASGDIDLSLGDRRYAQLFGTMRFYADQSSASAIFYYTAFVGNTQIGTAPNGVRVDFSGGQFTLDLHTPGSHLYMIELFDFRAWMEQFTFSVGSQGLYANVGGQAHYHNTVGGSLNGFIDLRNGGLAFAFNGRFSVSGSALSASAEGSLDITMRSAGPGESAIWVGDWGIVIFGSARGSGRIWPGPDVSVSATLDLSRWRLTFDVLGTDVTIQL